MSNGQESAEKSSSLTEIYSSMIALSIFSTFIANSKKLAKLPLRSLIKDELGYSPEAMATFFLVIGLAWYIKPIAGLLSDHFPLYNSRRRNYMLLGCVGGALVWIVTGLVPLYGSVLLVAMLAVNLMVVLGNSAAGGLLVEAGRELNAMGKLSSVRVIAMNGASLVAGPVGGWLAGRAFRWTCFSAAGVLLVTAVCLALLYRVEHEPVTPRRSVIREFRDVIAHLRVPAIWTVCLLSVAFYIAPSFSSLFYYYQRDVLELSNQMIGILGMSACAGGMLGGFCYSRIYKSFHLRTLVICGVMLSGGCALLYLLYRSLTLAFVLEPVLGFCVVLGVMPLHELSAQASPRGSEALGLAIILSLSNLGIALSDVLGAGAARLFTLDYSGVVVIYALATAASAAFVTLVPRAVFERS